MTDITSEYKNAIGAGSVYDLNALQNQKVDGVESTDTPVGDLTDKLTPELKPTIRVVGRIVIPRPRKEE